MPSPDTECLLRTLAETGNLFLACHAARMTRRQVASLQRSDAAFADAYDEAMDEAADRIEAEVWRRALEGVVEPLVKGGALVRDPETGEAIMTRRYSDPLLVLLLKGSKPEKYHTRAGQASSAMPASMIEEIAADNDPPRS